MRISDWSSDVCSSDLGGGKTELTADSSGFGGTTDIEAGTLAVNGALGGAVTVLAGGRLQGTGTVGDTMVPGTIAPRHSIGTLNVAGARHRVVEGTHVAVGVDIVARIIIHNQRSLMY